jgi:hypothetical protein
MANDCAARYARSLEARFVVERRIPDMLDELRRFYRKNLGDKLAAINSSLRRSLPPD